jgi:hypothetical protein
VRFQSMSCALARETVANVMRNLGKGPTGKSTPNTFLRPSGPRRMRCNREAAKGRAQGGFFQLTGAPTRGADCSSPPPRTRAARMSANARLHLCIRRTAWLRGDRAPRPLVASTRTLPPRPPGATPRPQTIHFRPVYPPPWSLGTIAEPVTGCAVQRVFLANHVLHLAR